jgi:hypothetical protein
MTSCREFRERLAVALRARTGGASSPEAATPHLSSLSWHEHLLACGDCRRLLAAEEALEILLASLPEPRLPRALARRVLARLESSRTAAQGLPTGELQTAQREAAALDALLELTGVEPAPPDLARNVLAGLSARRAAHAEASTDLRLDRLIDRLPAPEVPAGLSRTVLAALAGRRRALPREPRVRFDLQPTAPAARPWLRRLAGSAVAASLIGAGLWWALSGSGSEPTESGAPVAAVPGTSSANGDAAASSDRNSNEPSPSRGSVPGSQELLAPPRASEDEVLAQLDLLESWDLLSEGDVDVLLSSLDPVDEYLLEWSSDESSSQPREAPAATEDKKNG